MPNGYEHKDYGPHEYENHEGTSDCKHGCGCWMGPSRSYGPLGLDPFGECPNNPLDGKRREGTIDYQDVVSGRIRKLEYRLQKAESALKKVHPSKKKLAELVERQQASLNLARNSVIQIEKIVQEYRSQQNPK